VEGFDTRDQAWAALFDDLEVYHDRVRRHSSLRYVTRPSSSGGATRPTVNFVSTFLG
jgi:hypothetical protein